MKPYISDCIIRNLQNKYYHGKPANTSLPLAPSLVKKLEGGQILHNEVQYGETYPNSFADIYYPNDDFTQKRPTILYLHGGGYFMGSRTNGDPLASVGGGIAKQCLYMASLGFHVISMDYCLAPDYRYPAQLIQICEGIRYFSAEAERYHLDMGRVVLMGGSAGAVLSALLGAVHANPEFAKAVAIEPAMKPECLRGLAIDGAPMNMEWMDWGVKTMYRAWTGRYSIKSTAAQQIHVTDWVTEKYPPCFLTAGNDGCFPEHVQELGETLKAMGVHVEEYYMDSAITKQPHGYMGKWETDPYAKEGMDRMMAFVTRVTQP